MWGFLASAALSMAPQIYSGAKWLAGKAGEYISGSIIKPIKEEGIKGIYTAAKNVGQDVSNIATQVAPIVSGVGTALKAVGGESKVGKLGQFLETVGGGVEKVGKVGQTVADWGAASGRPGGMEPGPTGPARDPIEPVVAGPGSPGSTGESGVSMPSPRIQVDGVPQTPVIVRRKQGRARVEKKTPAPPTAKPRTKKAAAAPAPAPAPAPVPKPRTKRGQKA
jgi:hypothetical protein